MNRIQFISISVGAVIAAVTTSYLLSDRSNLSRANIKRAENNNHLFKPDQKEILFLRPLHRVDTILNLSL